MPLTIAANSNYTGPITQAQFKTAFDTLLNELRTNGASATLDRWRMQDGQRARAPWSLTREDLTRLVGAMGS